jgi:hypothetical protein
LEVKEHIVEEEISLRAMIGIDNSFAFFQWLTSWELMGFNL